MADVEEIIVSNPSDFANCCEQIARYDCIAMDTEFVGEDTYVPHLCLVQVATPTHLYLIDPITCGSLDRFWQLLHDPKRLVVVHSGREEIRICRHLTGIPPANIFDVQIAAGLLGLGYPLGYSALIQNQLRRSIHKAETLTDWRRRPLTREQIQYAFDDVRDLLRLWSRLSERLEALGRTSWAVEEFETAKQRWLVASVESERWRKLKGVPSLDSRRLAIARELYLWRETEASQRNRPARFILRDDLIAEIARRNPNREKDVQALRGLGRADVQGILDAVKRAKELPLEQLPPECERDMDPPQISLVSSLLSVILSDWCSRNELTAGIVTTANEVKQLVRAKCSKVIPTEECSLMRGWRKEHILPVLLDILEGRSAIRVDDLSKETPFRYESS